MRDYSKLDLGHKLLYDPYKNILQNLIKFATEVNAKDFDPVAKVYDGLLSAPPEIKEYYEALLGITSYYQHSQGGRGKYIEKKFASTVETCSLSIKLSEMPIWLEYPQLHRKKGIFTLQGLSHDEKRKLRLIDWNWMGRDDESTDVGNLKRDTREMILVESKNRVDSGGTAARREIWTSQKLGIIVNHMINDDKLYEKKGTTFSLLELLKNFNIEKIGLYIGILFDTKDSPATLEVDKQRGFYSSSKEGFNFIKQLVKTSTSLSIMNIDEEKLQMTLTDNRYGIKINIGALYGDAIPQTLFGEENFTSVSDLLLLRYDDMWFSQLLTIDERTILLKHNKNYTTIFKDLLKRDFELRRKYNGLIESEGNEKELNGIVEYLLNNHGKSFDTDLLPKNRDKMEYLADVVQFAAAAEI